MRLITILIKDDSVDSLIIKELERISTAKKIKINAHFGEISISQSKDNLDPKDEIRDSIIWFVNNMSEDGKKRHLDTALNFINTIISRRNDPNYKTYLKCLYNISKITKKDASAYEVLRDYDIIELPRILTSILKLRMFSDGEDF